MLSARDRALAVTDPPTLKTASVDMAASGDRAVVILSLYDGTVVRLRADRAGLLGLFKQAGSALKKRRTRDDPAGRRRDCVGDRNRQPNGDAIPPRAARPAA